MPYLKIANSSRQHIHALPRGRSLCPWTLLFFSACTNVPLSVEVHGEGQVNVAQQHCRSACNFQVPKTSGVEAIPADGWRFDGWSGICAGTDACVVGSGGILGATFVPTNELHIHISGLGRVQASDGRVCGEPDCVWVTTDALSFTPEPGDGQVFAGYGGACSSFGPCTLRSGDLTVEFAEASSIAIHFTGDGTGTVTDELGHIRCTKDCEVAAAKGSTWHLGLTLGAGSVYGEFALPCSGRNCTLTAPASIVVDFDAKRRVRITQAGDGHGSVLVNGTPACDGACDLLVDPAANLVIEGQPDGNSRFKGFGGDCLGARPCELQAGASPLTIEASFASVLEWNRNIELIGNIGFDVTATALVEHDGGVSFAAGSQGGFVVDGVPYPAGGVNATSIIVSLDGDGGVAAIHPLFDTGASGSYAELISLSWNTKSRELAGFGACQGGTFLGTPCPTSSAFSPILVRIDGYLASAWPMAGQSPGLIRDRRVAG